MSNLSTVMWSIYDFPQRKFCRVGKLLAILLLHPPSTLTDENVSAESSYFEQTFRCDCCLFSCSNSYAKHTCLPNNTYWFLNFWMTWLSWWYVTNHYTYVNVWDVITCLAASSSVIGLQPFTRLPPMVICTHYLWNVTKCLAASYSLTDSHLFFKPLVLTLVPTSLLTFVLSYNDTWSTLVHLAERGRNTSAWLEAFC